MIVQGFGNVGSNAATLLSEKGVSLVAVGDHTGYIQNLEGINPYRLSKYVKQHKSIKGYQNCEEITRNEFFASNADIFIPAATENQIDVEEANLLKTFLVVEGANGPCTKEGEDVLKNKKIIVIPDVLANSGGVIVSYFEWIQNKSGEKWHIKNVDAKLFSTIIEAFNNMLEISEKFNCDYRTACYIGALQRIQSVYDDRGIFP